MPEDMDLEALGAEGAMVGNEQSTDTGDIDGVSPNTTGTEDSDGKAPEQKAADTAESGAHPTEQEELNPENAVVKSKDGKHEIPYSVLAKEREDRIRLERTAQELNEKITLLERARETGEAVKTRDLSEIVDPDLLAQLEEESPSVAVAIKDLMSVARELDEELARVRPLAERSEREEQIQQKVGVEDAIAAVPKLLYVRTEDPEKFNEIAGFDEVLRTQPKWQGKPLQERFEAAVRMFEAVNGVIEVPGSAGKNLPADDASAKVDAAVKKAEAQAQGPHTLSDIPGGSPAPSNDHDAFEGMTSTALTERFMTMSPEQIEAELARLS